MEKEEITGTTGCVLTDCRRIDATNGKKMKW
jgi:hypothetical protein